MKYSYCAPCDHQVFETGEIYGVVELLNLVQSRDTYFGTEGVYGTFGAESPPWCSREGFLGLAQQRLVAQDTIHSRSCRLGRNTPMLAQPFALPFSLKMNLKNSEKYK